jgi:hypothetical protein
MPDTRADWIGIISDVIKTPTMSIDLGPRRAGTRVARSVDAGTPEDIRGLQGVVHGLVPQGPHLRRREVNYVVVRTGARSATEGPACDLRCERH